MKTFFFTIYVFSVGLCVGQQDGKFEYVDIGNGVMVRKFVSDDPSINEALESMARRHKDQWLETSGVNFLLKFSSVNDLASLSNMEFVDSQKQDLERILKDYKSGLDELTKAKDSGKIDETKFDKELVELKANYGKQSLEVLLPDQLNSIVAHARFNGRIFEFVTADGTKDFLEVSDAKRDAIVSRCKEINAKVEKLAQQQREIESQMRSVIQDVFDDELTADQKEKLKTKLNFSSESFFKSLNLNEMFQQTEFSKKQ